MKLSRIFVCACVGIFFTAAGLFAADAVSTNEAVTSPPVYVPDMSHANDPLPDGVLDWSSLMQTTNADADQASVQFFFSFTNVAKRADIALVTNVVTTTNFITLTNITATTNFTPVSVTILGAHASCGCTQPKLPPLPWTIPPGGKGEFSATVNVAGRDGILFKWITVTTDKGSKNLNFRITKLPPVIHILTDAERASGVAVARTDRQAIFRDDCANCHAKPAQGKYGKPLYDAVCGICHEAEHRAEAVPDLHNLKTPANDDFWRTWIAHGKPGSLMPAFSTAEGGPLTDMQIASLAAHLDTAIPPQSLPAATNSAPVN
jgi:mono/diheme cytochrome c family protein